MYKYWLSFVLFCSSITLLNQYQLQLCFTRNLRARLLSVSLYAPTITQCEPLRAHMRIDELCPTASTPCPLSLSHKKVQAISPSYAQSKAQKGTFPENFVTIGGCFECYMYCVMALGCLKKKEDELISLSAVSGLPL